MATAVAINIRFIGVSHAVRLRKAGTTDTRS
jgi:hypothetical protein